MNGRSVQHDTLVLERSYEVPPERAFAAWADREAKARWFAGPETMFELDFRVGGRERSEGTAPDGNTYTYHAVYHDIVAPERIVYTYDMHLQETRIAVTLATVEFAPEADDGTRLVLTEHTAFLDGHEFPAQRTEGWGGMLDALGRELHRGAPGA